MTRIATACRGRRRNLLGLGAPAPRDSTQPGPAGPGPFERARDTRLSAFGSSQPPQFPGSGAFGSRRRLRRAPRREGPSDPLGIGFSGHDTPNHHAPCFGPRVFGWPGVGGRAPPRRFVGHAGRVWVPPVPGPCIRADDPTRNDRPTRRIHRRRPSLLSGRLWSAGPGACAQPGGCPLCAVAASFPALGLGGRRTRIILRAWLPFQASVVN
jgi:hypothetical protein